LSLTNWTNCDLRKKKAGWLRVTQGSIASESLLIALFEQSPFSTVVYDAIGQPIALNPAFRSMWGIGEETIPPGYTVLADPQLEEQGMMPEVRRAFSGEQVVTPPIRYDISQVSATGKGKSIWTRGHFFPVRSPAGELTHVVLMHIDLTAQMEMESELRASEERLRLATSAAGIGTWDYNPLTGETYYDERCRRAFGLSPTDKIDYETYISLVHPADRERTRRVVEACFDPRGDGVFDIEYRTVGRDGITRWVRGMGRALFDTVNGERRAVRFVGTLLDVSERISLLEAERVARAEAEEARLRAEDANRAKSDFLAKMSHELRTPLNAIAGHAELIELGVHGEVSGEQVSALARIRRNGRHLLSLINDILDFSKLEAGAARLNVAEVRVAPVLDSLDSLISPLFEAKGVVYRIERCDDGLTALGDEERIVQICLNLLSNALKATEVGGEVSVRCECGDSSVIIRVSDTGSGIPSEKLEAVFAPFMQLGRSLNSAEGGIGLGLAISRELARAMGGDVTVESEVGCGSTFSIHLPRVSISPSE
jgi:PAS domain S-box-containing protein